MILFVVAVLILGQQEPRLVFVSEDAGPSPYDWPENVQQADYNIGFYGTQCIASRFARRMARETLGLPNSTEHDAANRVALTALALESQTWGYMDVAFVTAARATELVEAMEYLIPYLEQGEQPPEDARLFPLQQIQSDCQLAEQSKHQYARFIELETLGGITTVSGLVDCAALYTELDGTDWVENAELKMQMLMSLGQNTLQNDTPMIARLNRLRADFMTDFVGQGLTPSHPTHDLVLDRIEFCEQQFEALDSGGYLENHRP